MLYDSFKVLVYIPRETDKEVEELQGEIADYVTELSLAIEDVEMPEVVRSIAIQTDSFTPPLVIRNPRKE